MFSARNRSDCAQPLSKNQPLFPTRHEAPLSVGAIACRISRASQTHNVDGQITHFPRTQGTAGRLGTALLPAEALPRGLFASCLTDCRYPGLTAIVGAAGVGG